MIECFISMEWIGSSQALISWLCLYAVVFEKLFHLRNLSALIRRCILKVCQLDKISVCTGAFAKGQLLKKGRIVSFQKYLIQKYNKVLEKMYIIYLVSVWCNLFM